MLNLSNFVHLKKPLFFTKQILSGILFYSLSSQVVFLEASQISNRQDIGATMRIERTEKEQKALMKKLAHKKIKVEVEGKEIVQPKRPVENP